MDLKEFTKETIMLIVKGVNEANELLTDQNAYVTRNIERSSTGDSYIDRSGRNAHAVNIEFDVAVTATEVNDTKGGGGIKVVQLFQAGMETSKSIENQSVSRIKYSIPLVLGKKDNNNHTPL